MALVMVAMDVVLALSRVDEISPIVVYPIAPKDTKYRIFQIIVMAARARPPA